MAPEQINKHLGEVKDQSLRDKMAETLGMKSGFGLARATGQTMGLKESDSLTRRGFPVSQGAGFTPSVISPLGPMHLNSRDENTMYSVPSPMGYNRSGINRVDPVRNIED